MTVENESPLITKYRPATLEDLVGQDSTVKVLRPKLKTGKSNYFVTGHTGGGKTTISRIIAKYAMCETGDGCGKCKSCVRWVNGTHPDYMEHDCTNSSKKEDVQTVLQVAAMQPQFGRFRVILLDEVHGLSTAAASALLKPIEEPPKRTFFILATNEATKVKETIRNRATPITLQPIPVKALAEYLTTVSSKEGAKVPASVCLAVAEASGSMREALSLLSGVISFCQSSKKLDEEELLKQINENVLNTGGLEDFSIAINCVMGMILGKPARVVQALGSITSAISAANKVCYYSQYAIDYLCKAKGTAVMPWGENKKAIDIIVQECAKNNVTLTITRLYNVLESAVKARGQLQAFTCPEKSVLTMFYTEAALRNVIAVSAAPETVVEKKKKKEK